TVMAGVAVLLLLDDDRRRFHAHAAACCSRVPLHSCSVSSKLGRTSSDSTRRANSIATAGGRPLYIASTPALMHGSYWPSSATRVSRLVERGWANPYDIKIPRNVPTSAAPTLWPISDAGPSIAPIVITTPSTAATMPRPGSASATLPSVAAGLPADLCR